MTIQNIVAGVNVKLAGETLTYLQLRLFLSEVIDDINAKLSAKFPSFDNLAANADYNYFPDKYIRSVVIPGAAYKFYITDEEGTPTAQAYQYQYLDNLFLMARDYTELVPTDYQDRDMGYLSGMDLQQDPFFADQTAVFTGW